MHGHRIDREIPAEEVELERAFLHHRQGGRLGVVFKAGCGHVHALVIRQDDRGGDELLMRAHSRLLAGGKGLGKLNAVALDHHVNVQVAHLKEQIAGKAAHRIGPHPEVLRGLAQLAQEQDQLAAQRVSHQPGDVAGALRSGLLVLMQQAARLAGRVMGEEMEQVSAGDHAAEPVLVLLAADDGNQPLPPGDDQLLNLSLSAAFRQRGNVGAHELAHRRVAELMGNGLLRRPPRNQAEQPLGPLAIGKVAHHRQHGDIVAGQHAAGLGAAHIRRDCQHRRRHQLARHRLRPDMAVKLLEQLLLRLEDALVCNHC